METATLRSRMSNPVFSTPGALEALQALGASANAADLPAELHEFVHLRASQSTAAASVSTCTRAT
jgi:hypothetical protein